MSAAAVLTTSAVAAAEVVGVHPGRAAPVRQIGRQQYPQQDEVTTDAQLIASCCTCIGHGITIHNTGGAPAMPSLANLDAIDAI